MVKELTLTFDIHPKLGNQTKKKIDTFSGHMKWQITNGVKFSIGTKVDAKKKKVQRRFATVAQ